MPGPMLRWFLVLRILVSNCLLAQPFFLRKDIPVGENPSVIIPGDFNGDRRPDLAVSTDEGILVLLNAAGGNFGRPIRTETPRRVFWLGVAADFNGDGRDDLVGSGLLFLSRSDGTFLSPRQIGGQEALAAGDFNRDGKTDLVISSHDWNSGGLRTQGVRVLLGNGDGTFQSGATVTTLAESDVRVADFNRDGWSDVAMLPVPLYYPELTSRGSTVSTTLLVFLGRGDGTFDSEIRTQINCTSAFWSCSWSCVNFLVADFNADGLPDLFTADGVRLGKGDGSFQMPIRGGWDPPNTVAFDAADFTGDGYADLVMKDYEDLDTTSYIRICPGKGDGTLLAPVWQPAASFAQVGPAVDLDGDGRLDLVTANGAINTVSVLMARAEGGPALRRAVSANFQLWIVAPESQATLFVPTPATAAGASPPWPTRLGGISLEVRDSTGTTHLAPLVAVSPWQINFQVPAGAALGEATLAIASDGGTTEAGGMHVDAVAPSVFGTLGPPVLVEPDGTRVPVAWPIPLSTAGDRPIYLSFFGTGFHGANPDNVTCAVNGVRVPVVSAGPQGTPGLDRVDIRLLPEVLETIDWGWGDEGAASVTIRIGGVPANSVWIGVR